MTINHLPQPKDEKARCMTRLFLTFFLLTGITFISCRASVSKNNHQEKITHKEIVSDSSVVYQTENLIIKKLTNHIYKHVSFLNTDDFGKVSCNGMLVVNENKAIVFDTPTENKSSL